MAHLYNQTAGNASARFAAAASPGALNGRQQQQQGYDDYDDDDDDDEDSSQAHDRIRRNYLHHHRQQQQQQGGAPGAGENSHQAQDNTIHVPLNESYFASEQQALVNLLANIRQKFNSMQMFNPAKNQSIREQQQWSENEKYTLDSLNEIKGPLDEQFQWTRPEDGRNVWASKMQYFLAITSYSIGLGNVIRFPILVQKNGGLAFIIPFVIMLIVEGIPLFYLELAVGQRMRKAAISCWNLVSPFAAGIGIASAAVSFIIGLYYNTMVAWTLLYLWGSASKRPLPFAQCPAAAAAAAAAGSSTLIGSDSLEANSTADQCQKTGPFQYYWFRKTLDASEDVDHLGNFNLPVFFCLVFAWMISYLCLLKGLSSSKRMVYVASTLPYVILTIFFFKAIRLEGMSDGIYYLFEPEWSKLVDPYVWLQAAAQVFFSLGLGFGGLIALSSYNPVNNNCYRDAVKVSLINFFTSLYAGVVIFAILGYKANISHDKCLAQREQTIDYYLADYNLKVIDYGQVFKQVFEEEPKSGSGDASNPNLQNLTAEELEGSATDYYDSSDAIASIKSLDRQLDSISDKGSFDYGDSDTEFIIDASHLISKGELEKIIEEIPGLPQCSVRRELSEATQGTGLVFVVMTEAISQFNEAPTWATVFFLMLLTLGLDSQFGNLEGLLSSVADLNCVNLISRQLVTGFICALSFMVSVIMFAHGAGSYMFAIFDDYAGSFSLVLIAFFELIAISHIYGLKRFCDDCELMTGKRPPFIILLSWRYISPILLLIVIIATIRDFSVSLTYEAWVGDHLESKSWPPWCITLAAIIILSCVIWIPLVAILRYLKISIIPEESLSRCWFPAEELREFHNIQEEYKVTKLERVLFGFRSDDD